MSLGKMESVHCVVSKIIEPKVLQQQTKNSFNSSTSPIIYKHDFTSLIPLQVKIDSISKKTWFWELNSLRIYRHSFKLTFITFIASKDSLSLLPRFPSGGLSPGIEVGSRLISVFITVMCSLTRLYSCCIRPVMENRSTNRSASIWSLRSKKEKKKKKSKFLISLQPCKLIYEFNTMNLRWALTSLPAPLPESLRTRRPLS